MNIQNSTNPSGEPEGNPHKDEWAAGAIMLPTTPRTASRMYIVCSMPRSGSNLFCDGLGMSKCSGDPDEWFGPWRLHDRLCQWGLADPLSSKENPKPVCWESYVKALIEKTSSGDTCGIKLHWHHLVLVSQLYKDGDFIDLILRASKLDRSDLRWLYLHREDPVAVAVSAAIAAQTGKYFERIDGVISPARKEPSYDFKQIYFNYEQAKNYHANWLRWFEENKIDFNSFCYTELTQSWSKTIARALTYIHGREVDVCRTESLFMRQSNHVNREFIERFLVDLEHYSTRTMLCSGLEVDRFSMKVKDPDAK